MKTVHNTRQVIHLWANASQSKARNSSDSVSFYSHDFNFGRHKVTAQVLLSYSTAIAFRFVHPVSKEAFALVGNSHYSVTTSKHKSGIWRAANHLTNLSVHGARMGEQTGWVQRILDRKSHEQFYKRELRKHLDSIKCAKNVVQRENAACVFADTLKQAKDIFHKLFNRAFEFKHDETLISSLVEASNKRSETRWEKQREKEAKERAKWEAERPERERLAKERQAALLIENAKKLEAWKRGENVWLGYDGVLEYPILRLKPNDNSIVETSQGAEVPLNLALAFYLRLKNHEAQKGQHVGAFTFNSEENGIVTIGCHCIEMAELDRFYASLESMTSKG